MKKKLAILVMALSLTFSVGIRAETASKEVNEWISYIYTTYENHSLNHIFSGYFIDNEILNLIDLDVEDAVEGEVVGNIESFECKDTKMNGLFFANVDRLYRTEDDKYIWVHYYNDGGGWEHCQPREWEN